MVKTRRQAGLANGETPACKVESPPSSKPEQVAKTVTQKRQKPDATLQQLKTTVSQARRGNMSLASQLGTCILFLFIGEGRDLVTIHKDLLPESTKIYIQEKNQGNPVYQLADEDINTVKIYQLYLYTNQIFSIDEKDQDSPDNGKREAHSDAEWTKLAHAYMFGVTVRDERFANACIDAIIEKMTVVDRYPTSIAGEVYDFTEVNDGLRKLIVDVHVYQGLGQWVREPHDDAHGPGEFLKDVISGLAEAGEEVWEEGLEMPWEGIAGGCRYHTHKVTQRCV